MNLTVKISRFNPETDSEPRLDSFSVPYTEGMTILDCLNYIQNHLDKTLAFRWECRSGICGTCGLTYNDTPVLSCSRQINPKLKEHRIAPLANFPVERDLIANLAPTLRKFAQIKPYLQKTQEIIVTKAAADASKPFRKCIECGCCIGASIALGKNPTIIDPMAAVKLARFATDPRDTLNRRKLAQENGIRHYTRTEAKKLATICPRRVPIDKAMKLLKRK